MFLDLIYPTRHTRTRGRNFGHFSSLSFNISHTSCLRIDCPANRSLIILIAEYPNTHGYGEIFFLNLPAKPN